ncbi:hypothetical protein OROMI_011582 [Orobanche minor]
MLTFARSTYFIAKRPNRLFILVSILPRISSKVGEAFCDYSGVGSLHALRCLCSRNQKANSQNESAKADLKSSQVTVKGVVKQQSLADYVYKEPGKHAAVVKVESEKKEEKSKEEKSSDDAEKAEAKENGKEKKEGRDDSPAKAAAEVFGGRSEDGAEEERISELEPNRLMAVHGYGFEP